MKHHVHMPFKPKPKQRPRMSKKSRRAYTPQETKDYEAAVAECWDGPLFEGPVHVDIQFRKDSIDVTVSDEEFKSPLRADIDNLVKSLLDGLQIGGAFANDRQVVSLKAVKR
jgi:Holliday junction resolvase RusA-like endonuclease